MTSLYCTDGFPQQYWWYRPVLLFSSTVLNILHGTEGVHLLYWWYPPVLMISSTVLNTLHFTNATPHSADSISSPYRIPSTVLMLSPLHITNGVLPLYWASSVVMDGFPAVLMVSFESKDGNLTLWDNYIQPWLLLKSWRYSWEDLSVRKYLLHLKIHSGHTN